MSETKSKTLVSANERNKIRRILLTWLNTFQNLPARIDYEDLPGDSIGMMLSTIQAAYKVQQYIDGGYVAQYQFKIVYRSQPDDNNSRLAADELLNELGEWAETRSNWPEIEGVLIRKIQMDSDSALYAAYDDGSRDHQILMSLNYEVI